MARGDLLQDFGMEIRKPMNAAAGLVAPGCHLP
jgi:hypothetical protein